MSELFWTLNMLYFFVFCSLLCVLFFFFFRIFPKLKGAADSSVEEKSKSDNKSPQINFDVFVSFRGKDIRDGFLSHLSEAFNMKKIHAFIDDKNLKKGEEIWPSLVGAIEGSIISLIIFSPNYASSRWCLEELVTILECREKYGQIVIPVFYHVEPSNVRHQLESYEKAFAKHGKKYKTKVPIWRHALNKSADLSGIESSKFRDDADFLKEIVSLVLTRLDKPMAFNSKGFVRIDEKIAEVKSLIDKKPQDTRLIGIWGMGGIGKTTLAQEIFNKLRSEYDGSYFLFNERVESSKHGIISVKEKLFSELLGHAVKIDTPNSLPNDIVRRKKVLIVLDDVNDSNHIEQLLGTLDNFGSGSRIMVTTRDEQVLNANNADVYHLKEFSFDKALELFQLNAFNQSDNQSGYDELSVRVVNYAKGIPLVLKVLARFLHRKNKEVWKSELDKLEKMPLREVYDIMKLSYDDLDRKEQQIFLDLACFFLTLRMRINVGYLNSLLRDSESDNSIVVGLDRLKDKALITFYEDDFVSMPDSLQEMAWEIVRRESIEDPGSHSRLWDLDDIYKVLKIDKDTGAIRSIRIHLPTIKKEKLSPQIFAKMTGLQFLEIAQYNYDSVHQLDILGTNACWAKWQCWPRRQKPCIVDILAKGFQFLATELRFLSWENYPLKSLPENFSTQKLVVLRFPHSKMEKLWHGKKDLVSLKELNLIFSKNLKELPDLSEATNLEVLILWGCSMLTSVHPSVFSLGKLEKLDLFSCKSLTILVSNSHLRSLSYLNLDWCENLTEFSLTSDNMKELRLNYTSIKELPASFGHQCKLKSVDLTGTYIERLPSSINNLTQLQHLDLNNCSKLQIIPELPPFLETLNAKTCTSLQSLPELPTSLKTLAVKDCHSLHSLPELPPSLTILDARYCGSLQRLPKLPPSLKTLDVSWCRSLLSLPELSQSLETLNVSQCQSLHSLPDLPQSLETLNISYCPSLQSLPELPRSLKTLDVSHCPCQCLPELPLSLKTLDARNCRSLQSLPELPPSLQTLDVTYCYLQRLPELSPSLKTLDVGYCGFLQSLPKLPLSLETLDARDCRSLQSLPELPPSLKTLNVTYCYSLLSLPKLPLSLKSLDATHCRSLKTVLFPSTAVEQVMENRKQVLFWNCLNLDEHSLVAIGLNAQINMMKFANQHASTPTPDHVENYNDYEDNYRSYQAIYMYRGSSVPEWLEYKTTKDYIIIDLSSAPPSPLLGFFFCFVFGKHGYTMRGIKKLIQELEFNISISDGKKDSVRIYIDCNGYEALSDHACVLYDQRCSAFLNSRAKSQTRFKIQVRTKTRQKVYDQRSVRTDYHALPKYVLKEFGVSLTRPSAYESFIQQMELHNSQNQFH